MDHEVLNLLSQSDRRSAVKAFNRPIVAESVAIVVGISAPFWIGAIALLALWIR